MPVKEFPDEMAVATAFISEHVVREPKIATYFKGDVPDLKEHWVFEIIDEGVQRFARNLPRELWLTARSHSDGDFSKSRTVFAAITCGMSSDHVAPSEKRLTNVQDALERLNEAVRLIDTPVPPKWWQRFRWRRAR